MQTPEMKYDVKTSRTEYRIQPNDVLSVTLQSRDPDQTTYFNSTSGDTRTLQNANPAALFLTGYTVDLEGYIDLAIVGKMQVKNMTVPEIKELVQTEIDKYLVNALVSVKMTSFKISVLGDVKNPGTNYVYNGQSTILEALSAAGDLNLSAKRNRVQLIRQTGEGTTVVKLDLTDPSLIDSPYYFLHPNDVIYVETSKPNIAQSNLNVLTFVLSTISTGLLILNFVTN